MDNAEMDNERRAPTDFEPGRILCATDIVLTADMLSDYLSVAGADGVATDGYAPAIIPLARAIGELVKRFQDCAGAIHFSESLECGAMPKVGETVRAEVAVNSARRRGDSLFLNIRTRLRGADGGEFAASESVIILAS